MGGKRARDTVAERIAEADHILAECARRKLDPVSLLREGLDRHAQQHDQKEIRTGDRLPRLR